jgi:hypothetical protein
MISFERGAVSLPDHRTFTTTGVFFSDALGIDWTPSLARPMMIFSIDIRFSRPCFKDDPVFFLEPASNILLWQYLQVTSSDCPPLSQASRRIPFANPIVDLR